MLRGSFFSMSIAEARGGRKTPAYQEDDFLTLEQQDDLEIELLIFIYHRLSLWGDHSLVRRANKLFEDIRNERIEGNKDYAQHAMVEREIVLAEIRWRIEKGMWDGEIPPGTLREPASA